MDGKLRPSLEPALTLKQEQKQVLAPVQIQSLTLLAYNVQELSEYVSRQMLENPLLETGEPEEKPEVEVETEYAYPDTIDTVEPYEDAGLDWQEAPFPVLQRDYVTSQASAFPEEQVAALASPDQGFRQSLLLQLSGEKLEAKEEKAARAIVEALDEDGYLRVPLDALSRSLGIGESLLERALARVQCLEPAGVGARDLAESLCLQVPKGHPDAGLLRRIAQNFLTDLAARRSYAVAKACGVEENRVKEAFRFIRSLTPYPVSEKDGSEKRQYVAAELVVKKESSNAYGVSYKEHEMPPLRISAYYRKLLEQGSGNKEAQLYLRQKLTEAGQLIEQIERRRQTVLRIAEIIVERQKDFFAVGPDGLRPLTLKEVAAEAELHESTVSRAVNGKYMETPKGLFPLKYFFSASLSTQDGGRVSALQVKAKIAAYLAAEDKKRPLSDREIGEALQKEGIRVARRTVAKYRDALGLPSHIFRREEEK